MVNEIDTALVDHMEFYLLNYFRPAVYEQTEEVKVGREIFEAIRTSRSGGMERST